MHHYRTALISWVPLAVAITAMSLLVEVTVQQSYRTSLNDPQQQIAEDTARVVAAGVDPSIFAPKGAATEISSSLGTWMAFYDAQLAPKVSTGLLHGTIPTIPGGVFKTATEHGSYSVTWQPEPGVRQALVIVPAGEKGFAVAGRNMRAVEDREAQLGWLVLVGWAASMLATFLAFIFAEPLVKRFLR
jgi:hypothetical protein